MDAAIFVQNGQSLCFYMDACPERERVESIVTAYGGQLVDEPTSNSIELVPVKRQDQLRTTKRHQVYSFELVADSLRQGELVPMKDYEFKREFLSRNQRKIKPRQKYSQRDNQLMIEYQRRMPGNPASSKYWENAIDSGLALRHPPHSLRHHWQHIILKQLAATGDAGPLKQRLKGPVEPIKRVKVSSSLNNDAEQEPRESQSILDAFDKLVRRCSRSRGKRISESAVLAALLRFRGEVQSTLKAFATAD